MSDHPVCAPARELSPEEQEERVETCRALDEQVKTSVRRDRDAVREWLAHLDQEAA